MNLLKPKEKPFKLFLALAILFSLLVPKNKTFYSGVLFNIYDEIFTYNIGLSSLKSYGKSSEYKNQLKTLSKAPKILGKILFGVDRTNSFPKIYLDIKFKNFKTLFEDRDRFINEGIAYDFNKVKGKITFNGKKMNCDVRLKGDLSEHWRSTKRMSFRINLKGDNSILTFKSFSIHKTDARQHPYDQTFQDIQKSLGNISSSHRYANIIVNGEDWGIMNIEEHMSKELLEKQNRKESIIFKLGDQKDWIYSQKNRENVYNDYLLSDEYLSIKLYQEKKYLRDSIYRKYYTYVSNEILKKESKIFDINSFSKSLILSLAWNNTHTLAHVNSRYYFNPYDLKIHPITTDQGYFSSINSKLSDYRRRPYEKVVKDSNFASNYKTNLMEVNNSLSNSQQILDKWHEYFPLDEKISSSILINNIKYLADFEKFKSNSISFSKQTVSDNTNIQLKYLPDHIIAKHFDNGEIQIFNLINEKIKIKSICIGNKEIQNISNLEINKHNYEYRPSIIKTSLKGLNDNNIEIQTEIDGFQRLFTLGYTFLTDNIYSPIDKKTNYKDFDFIELREDDKYFIKKGEWSIKTPIILNKGLEIEKGTILDFDENSYLIIKGKLIIRGTENEEVILKSSNGFWKGIYVLNSDEKSIIKNVTFLNVKNLSDGLLNLTGGISFYKSDVDFINVNFKNNQSEDFLNIIHSNFLIDNVVFANCPSDAFDSDFSNGVITNSTFSNILGDGVDFSGSSVNLSNTFFFNVKDKSVSVGENSSLLIKSINVENSGVGIAVKDGSNAFVVNSTFKNIKLNSLMTYTKKSFYSTPKLTSIGNIFQENNNCCLSQVGSELINNKIKISQKYFDVDSLYQTQIMKK